MGGAAGTAFLTAAVALVVWDLVVAAQVARVRIGPEWFRWINSFAGLLLIPAIVVVIADGSLITARITSGIAWLWPLTLALFAAQSVGAVAERLVAPVIGVPVVAWNVALALVAAGRLYADGGAEPPVWLATLGAAQAHALGLAIGADALTSPVALLPPLMAPVHPARWRGRLAVRVLVALVAAAGIVAIGRELPAAGAVVRSYAAYAPQPLQERPRGDFAIGVRILPIVRDVPGPYALRMDLGLVDSISARAVLVVVDPRARAAALDSLARALDPYRRDSVLVIIAVGNVPRARGASPDDRDALRDRLAFVDQVARRLRPRYLLPEPADGDHGGRSLETREELLARAAVLAHAVSARIKIGVSLRAVASDSALYAWATPADSPVEAIGFAITAGFGGAATIDAQLARAARWMRAASSVPREHWIWDAAAAPVAHGAMNQAYAFRGLLAWGTSHAAVNGVIFSGAADYAGRTGLRSASGRLRPAVELLTRAIDDLSETRAPPVPPAAATSPAPAKPER